MTVDLFSRADCAALTGVAFDVEKWGPGAERIPIPDGPQGPCDAPCVEKSVGLGLTVDTVRDLCLGEPRLVLHFRDDLDQPLSQTRARLAVNETAIINDVSFDITGQVTLDFVAVENPERTAAVEVTCDGMTERRRNIVTLKIVPDADPPNEVKIAGPEELLGLWIRRIRFTTGTAGVRLGALQPPPRVASVGARSHCLSRWQLGEYVLVDVTLTGTVEPEHISPGSIGLPVNVRASARSSRCEPFDQSCTPNPLLIPVSSNGGTFRATVDNFDANCGRVAAPTLTVSAWTDDTDRHRDTVVLAETWFGGRVSRCRPPTFWRPLPPLVDPCVFANCWFVGLDPWERVIAVRDGRLTRTGTSGEVELLAELPGRVVAAVPGPTGSVVGEYLPLDGKRVGFLLDTSGPEPAVGRFPGVALTAAGPGGLAAGYLRREGETTAVLVRDGKIEPLPDLETAVPRALTETTIVGELLVEGVVRPFRWTDGTVTVLELPADAVSAKLSPSSSAETLVGTLRYRDGTQRGFVQHAEEELIEVPIPDKFSSATATGVSDDAGVVVGTAFTTRGKNLHMAGFAWHPNGGFIALPKGISVTEVAAISPGGVLLARALVDGMHRIMLLLPDD